MFFRLLVPALLAAALTCTASLAATLVDRSPFAQGHWWDPNRSGNGFEIFNVGNEAMAIWYTFDDAQRPVWYTAQGPVGAASWPLLQHQWAGRPARRLHHRWHACASRSSTPESAEVAFDIGGRTGSWRIQPFNLSGMQNEVDHSGSYFNPANSGWGLTLTHQGDVLGGVLYTYDTAGAPDLVRRLRPRQQRERGPHFRAAARARRAPTPTTSTQPAGRLAFEFRSESRARDRATSSPRRWPRASTSTARSSCSWAARPRRAPPIASSRASTSDASPEGLPAGRHADAAVPRRRRRFLGGTARADLLDHEPAGIRRRRSRPGEDRRQPDLHVRQRPVRLPHAGRARRARRERRRVAAGPGNRPAHERRRRRRWAAPGSM